MTRTAMAVALLWLSSWAMHPVLAQTTNTTPRQLCASLQGTKIAAGSIGLPTNGAVVVSASLVMATDAGNNNGEFCKVLGAIHPVDPIAPDIKFEVNLPTNWNNRMLQMGGGGYDGSLVTGLGGSSNQLPSAPTPLGAGLRHAGQRLRPRGHRLRRHVRAERRGAGQLRSSADQENARRRHASRQGPLRIAAAAFVFLRRIAGRSRRR